MDVKYYPSLAYLIFPELAHKLRNFFKFRELNAVKPPKLDGWKRFDPHIAKLCIEISLAVNCKKGFIK